MRNRIVSPIRRAFTLIEILIVVVILGILAAIVIPQFTDASQEASASSVASQLQTLRGQVELYRVRNAGVNPDLTADWTDLLVPPGGEPPYLQSRPRNPLMPANNQDTVSDVADGSTAWVWMPSLINPTVMQIYAWDSTVGTAGAIFDENGDGNPA